MEHDLVHLLQPGKYVSDAEAFWAEGDFNGNLIFDQLDLVGALHADTYLRGRYAG